MENKGIWSEAKEQEAQKKIKADVLKAFNKAEKEKRPPIRALFEDIYEEVTEEQVEQMKKLKDVLERYPGEYDVDNYEGGRGSLNTE